MQSTIALKKFDTILTPEIQATGIYLFAKNNDYKSLATLLKLIPFNINKPYYTGEKIKTVLQVATEYEAKEAIAVLEQHKKSNQTDTADQESLNRIVLNGKSINSLLEILIPNDEIGTLIELKSMIDKLNIEINWKFFLHWAVQEGSSNVISFLLTIINPNERYEDFQPCLTTAIFIKNSKIVKQLIDAHADVRATSQSGSAPIHSAIVYQNEEILQMLLRSEKVDIHQPNEKQHHMTPAHVTTFNDNAKAMEALIDRGVNLNLYDDFGGNPLHLAVHHNAIDTIKVILRKPNNIDINALTKTEKISLTAVGMAARSNSVEILQLLHEAKADLMKTNPAHGLTPLHIASMGGNFNAVMFLLNYYPKKLPVDNQGRSPIDLAEDNEIKIILSARPVTTHNKIKYYFARYRETPIIKAEVIEQSAAEKKQYGEKIKAIKPKEVAKKWPDGFFTEALFKRQFADKTAFIEISEDYGKAYFHENDIEAEDMSKSAIGQGSNDAKSLRKRR